MSEIDKLRAELDLKPGQLLTNSNGEYADILAVNDDGTVLLGVLSRREPVIVRRDRLVPQKPKKPLS